MQEDFTAAEFDNQIRRARIAKGVSQAKLARMIGLRQSILSQWELGKSRPSRRDVEEILQELERLDADTVRSLRKHRVNGARPARTVTIVDPRPRQDAPLDDEGRKARLPFLFLDSSSVKSTQRTAIALFAGIGGMSLGFRWAGFKILGFVEIHSAFRQIYEANFPDARCLGTDIRLISDSEIACWSREFGEVDTLFGGPPCQGFSLAGKRNVHDERNFLFNDFARVARILRPRTLLMENVSLMSSMRAPDGSLVTELMGSAFAEAGYRTRFQVLRAEEYGVPQSRNRLFMLGVRNDLGIDKISFPSPTHGPRVIALDGRRLETFVSFREATADLGSLSAGEVSAHDPWHRATPHPPHVVRMLESVPEGKSAHENVDPSLRPSSGYNTTYKRIRWDEPCSTISTNFNMISGCRNVHPADTRALTVREVMRCQSFPDSFRLTGRMEDVRNGIGNAVPPLLSMSLAHHISSVVLLERPMAAHS